jgi:molecular chaperone GrpE
MTTGEKNHQITDNQDIEAEEGFIAEDENAAENSTETTGESAETDKMADKTDKMSDAAVEPPTPEEEAAMWRDKYTRLSAEYENYRRRTTKEKMDIIAAGGEDVVRSMLEVLDDIDRALTAIANTTDLEAIKQGIALIDNKLRGALKSKGLTEIEAAGQELDTDLHEAIARIEVEEKAMKGKIIDVVQKGYKLKEKIIRYAKVVVGQ